MRQQKKTFWLGLIALVVCLMPVASSASTPPQQTGASAKSQPVALPAAKEELLGELSPQTEPPGSEITKRPWKEFWSMAKPESDYSFDPESLRFAARAKQGKKWVLVVDGKEKGRFDGIESVLIGPQGQHVIYSAKRDTKWVKMMDDKEIGPAFDKLGAGFWFFGDAGLEHHAYAAQRGEKWLMITDGKESPEFAEVGSPRFSAKAKHLTFSASLGPKKWVMCVDGNRGPEFEEVGPPVFSPDGERLAYRGKRSKDREVLVLDGKEMSEFEYGGHPVSNVPGLGVPKEFDSSGQPVFSPDSKHWAYRAKRDGKHEAVILAGTPNSGFRLRGFDGRPCKTSAAQCCPRGAAPV